MKLDNFLSFRSVFQPSSGVLCWTWQPTRNFELSSLSNLQESIVLTPLTRTRYKCWVTVSIPCYLPVVGTELNPLPRMFSLRSTFNQTLILVEICVLYVVWLNFNLLHNSVSNSFPNQLFEVLYSFCTSLLHSLTISLIVSSLLPHNTHLPFCYGLSLFT